MYMSRHSDQQQKKEAPKEEHTPISRRTVGLHFVNLPLQADESCPMFSSATRAVGEWNESLTQPDAPIAATRKDLWTPPSWHLLGTWPISL